MGLLRNLISVVVLFVAIGAYLKFSKFKTIPAPMIRTHFGEVSGVVMTSSKGRDIHAYKSIPYAKPPVGKLRFQRPEPIAEPWQGILDGTKNAPLCVQALELGFISTVHGQEDCLYLNIYVPDTAEKNLPVMFYIHGGGWAMGDGTDALTGPAHLLDKDVVLVTVHYRLGALGFLNLGSDEIAAGNQGLWDQREAMKWVKNNIGQFNGDPEKVTIFGVSAGGFSVSAHLLSIEDKSGPLYRGAIPQSGTLSTAFLLRGKHPLTHYHDIFAEKLGCAKDLNNANRLKCIQNLDIHDIMAHKNMFDDCNIVFGDDAMSFPTAWRQSDDSKFSSDPFFPHDPFKMMSEGKFSNRPKGQVKVMTGYCKHEGILYTGALMSQPEKLEKFE